MKIFLYLGFLLSTISALAQDRNDPLDIAPPRIIIQTGIGVQWFGYGYKLYNLSAERPVGHYWHLGLQGNFYLSSQPDFYLYSTEFLGGIELGLHSKHFLHGRFSGRKSGLYLGPDIRFGSRRFRVAIDNVFPLPPMPNYQNYKEATTKFMLRWGMQWQFGRARLELAAPFGAEIYKPVAYNGNQNSQETRFVLLPTLQLGLGL